jgi:hypothetical protein
LVSHDVEEWCLARGDRPSYRIIVCGYDGEYQRLVDAGWSVMHWKTNGGYISTIYVGNRRIYGPLRDNPEEAGYDRQRLIEAKSFVKSEIEMRNYIATLKTNPSSLVSMIKILRKNEQPQK